VSKLYVLLNKSVVLPVLEAPHPGRQSKLALYIYIGFIYMALYSLVNRGIYGYVAKAHVGGSPLYSSIMCNRGIYATNIVLYIPRLLHWLAEEYNLYFSVIELCSLVITDKPFCVSCSA
jgi:hypothetical protein